MGGMSASALEAHDLLGCHETGEVVRYEDNPAVTTLKKNMVLAPARNRTLHICIYKYIQYIYSTYRICRSHYCRVTSRPATISAQEKCLCQKLDGSAGPTVQKIELKGGTSWDQSGTQMGCTWGSCSDGDDDVDGDGDDEDGGDGDGDGDGDDDDDDDDGDDVDGE